MDKYEVCAYKYRPVFLRVCKKWLTWIMGSNILKDPPQLNYEELKPGHYGVAD